MVFIVGLSCLIIGICIAHFTHRETIKNLERENNQIRSLSADRLTKAYERIEQLEEDNKKLFKLLNSKNNDTRN